MSSDLLLAALAISLRTCIFYLELGNMVGFAMVFLGLAFLWLSEDVTFFLCCSCFCDISGLFVI